MEAPLNQEALEDIALARAIAEGSETAKISREEVFSILDRKLIDWVLWVDVEGFSASFKSEDNGQKALKSLIDLVKTLFYIGKYYGEQGRGILTVHQLSDGFFINMNMENTDLHRPLNIAIALMRTSLLNGFCLKIGLGRGQISASDLCVYGDEIRRYLDGDRLSTKGFLMTRPEIVTGLGLIDAYEMHEKSHGPVICVRKDLLDALPRDYVSVLIKKKHFLVDWVHADIPEVANLQSILGYEQNAVQLAKHLGNYLDKYPGLKCSWRRSAKKLIKGYENTKGRN